MASAVCGYQSGSIGSLLGQLATYVAGGENPCLVQCGAISYSIDLCVWTKKVFVINLTESNLTE